MRERGFKGIIIMMLAFTKLNKSLGDNKKLYKCGMDNLSARGSRNAFYLLLTDNFDESVLSCAWG